MPLTNRLYVLKRKICNGFECPALHCAVSGNNALRFRLKVSIVYSVSCLVCQVITSAHRSDTLSTYSLHTLADNQEKI